MSDKQEQLPYQAQSAPVRFVSFGLLQKKVTSHRLQHQEASKAYVTTNVDLLPSLLLALSI